MLVCDSRLGGLCRVRSLRGASQQHRRVSPIALRRNLAPVPFYANYANSHGLQARDDCREPFVERLIVGVHAKLLYQATATLVADTSERVFHGEVRLRSEQTVTTLTVRRSRRARWTADANPLTEHVSRVAACGNQG